MIRKYRLAIVMHRATQFDGPLFAKLTSSKQMELKVYYTAPGENALEDIDPELGFRPDWGEAATAGYEYFTRSSGIHGFISLLRNIVAGHPDLIIVSGYRPLLNVLIALYAWHRGMPIGLRSDTTLRHTMTQKASLKGKIKSLILKILFKFYATAHPVGTLARENLLHYGFAKDQMFVFPYAVNNEWFCTESGKYRAHQPELRRAIGIEEKAFVVLGILKFNEREDPITLVLGYNELLKKWHGLCHLLLVGDGPLRENIETLIRDKEIANVTLKGYTPFGDLPKYYALADVFVHPGVGESWGVSVNESMACCLPVVCSDRIGSHIDLVREGKTGFVFKTKNAKSLAQCLANLASDSNLCKTMGNDARALVSNWGYNNTEKSLMSALRYVSPHISYPE